MVMQFFERFMDRDSLREATAETEVEFGAIPDEMLKIAREADLDEASRFWHTVCFPRRAGRSGAEVSVHDYLLVWSGPLQRRGDLRRRRDVREALLVAPDKSMAVLGRIVTSGDYQGHHTRFYADACQRL